MTDKTKFSESTIIGSLMNRAEHYSGNTSIQSWFDSSGRKTGTVHSITWAESRENIAKAAKALISLGLKPSDRAAVCGLNTPRWLTAVFSIILCRATSVPIYPTSKSEDVWWCLYDSASKIVFCHGKDQLNKVLSNRDRLNDLKWIIVMDPDVACDQPGFLSFADFMKKGESSAINDSEIEKLIMDSDENDLACIIYTSGTTGRPKGVMLTNKNFVSQRSVAGEFQFSPADIWLAHLPMCHSLGFTSDLLNSGHQGGTLFIADSIETEEMRKNLRACRPTVMTSVPRLWEKLYLQINMKVRERPEFVQRIVRWAMNTGQEKYKHVMENTPVPLSLRLKLIVAGRIFSRIRKEAGLERLRICITGGGPIHPDLLIFFGS
ncbi:MAG: AMP-binding protein, partial [Spirochaetes bacterium]|nr:AMP-binding protein [Spirochaetota bacterium]